MMRFLGVLICFALWFGSALLVAWAQKAMWSEWWSGTVVFFGVLLAIFMFYGAIAFFVFGIRWLMYGDRLRRF